MKVHVAEMSAAIVRFPWRSAAYACELLLCIPFGVNSTVIATQSGQPKHTTVRNFLPAHAMSVAMRGVRLQDFVVYLLAVNSAVMATQPRQPKHITFRKLLPAHAMSMAIRGVRLEACVIYLFAFQIAEIF